MPSVCVCAILRCINEGINMSKGHRAFWLFMALLFLVTTIGFTGIVVWQIKQDNKRSQEASNLQKALQEAQNKQSTTPKTEDGKLKGTKLENFTPVASVTELQKVDITVGTGEEVPNDPATKVTVHYTGALAKDGTIFESSRDSGQTATFPLNGVISGWTQGIPGMKVGGTRRLVIPAPLAYGDRAQGDSIPANSDLVFDVELVAIDK